MSGSCSFSHPSALYSLFLPAGKDTLLARLHQARRLPPSRARPTAVSAHFSAVHVSEMAVGHLEQKHHRTLGSGPDAPDLLLPLAVPFLALEGW